MTEQIVSEEHELNRWLETLRPQTAIFCKAEVRSPWGFSIEGRDMATFHILTCGEAVLEVEGVEHLIELTEGTLVLLPTGAAHALRDSEGSAAPELMQAVGSGTVEGKWVSFGSATGPRTEMVCGGCALGVAGAGAPDALLPLLPPVLTHTVDPALVRVVASEAEGLAAGTEAVLMQLLTLVVLQALRAHLSERSAEDLRAGLSPDVARAISYVHGHLSDDLGVEDLCKRTALSRTVLTQRFQETLAVAPMEYVRLARLSRAAELLRATDWGLQRVARAVGYASASTFSRAFRRRYGESPGAFRVAAD